MRDPIQPPEDRLKVGTDENGFRTYTFRGTVYYSRDKARLERIRAWEREE